MNGFTNSDLLGIAIFALILILLAYRFIKGMPKVINISAMRRRMLTWFQVALVLTVLQLNFKSGDWGFAVILGLIVLFTGSIWYAARYYDIRRPADPEEAAAEPDKQ
ncbi:hypothetical protein [Paenibacillus sp. sgz500958]|uniref:hypothetical protein n=1 Tax=Paenibacillus sp. sgz500958 TaxID=3242475 RepID=UPI0036D328FB